MKTKFKLGIIGFLLFVLLLFNQRDKLGCFVETIPEETSTPPSVFFCPDEDCETQLINLIKNANESVNCAFYDLDLEKVIEALKLGKNVKLVMDEDNVENIEGLNLVISEHTPGLMHNKFCIIDNKIVLTGSFNPTERGNFHNNNNLIIIHSQYLVKNYNQEFEELWNKKFGSGEEVKYPKIYFNGEIIENYFCPEDSCTEHVIDDLADAEKSIYFMSFMFTSDEIGDVLMDKHEKRLDIKGVFEKFGINQWSEYQKLEEKGMNVKKDKNNFNMHHKVFIIDNKTVITGSFNPTKAANEKNDENILIINDKTIVKKYLDEFGKIWDT